MRHEAELVADGLVPQAGPVGQGARAGLVQMVHQEVRVQAFVPMTPRSVMLGLAQTGRHLQLVPAHLDHSVVVVVVEADGKRSTLEEVFKV